MRTVPPVRIINEMFFELCERYGTRLKGLWVDGVFNHIPRGAAQERLKETCRTFNPAMVLTMNAGFVEGQLDIRTEENFPDYRCWEINRWVDYINDLKFSRYQVATCLAQQYWWTTVPQDYEFNMQPASEMFQYLVALSSVTQQGGMLASTGIYPVAAEKHGQENDLWLNGMKEMLLEVNSYLDPVAESVKNTSVGKAFPTTENITIKDLTWGVSTESRDGRNVYLHVLKAPEGNTLTLPATADGTELKSDAVIMNFDKTTTPVTLTKTASGYTVTLPEGVEWNEVDTVIKTTRVGYGAAGIGEQNFETLEEALAAAEAKDVIKLYTDVEADRVILNPEVTLDLNGNTLAADYFVGFKGSAVYGGKLKAPKDKVVLDRTNNGYLSVYDADGYVFTTVKLTGRAKFVSDTTYAFSPVFESVVHKMLEQGYEKSGVSVVVRVMWKETGNYEAKQDYIYLDEMVQRVIGSYDETKLNYKRAFSAAFAGSEAGAAENVKVSAVVLSETGVEIASVATTFETEAAQ